MNAPSTPGTAHRGRLVAILTLAATYALLGTAGLTLTIAPGYANPVFPAAGLALAAVLRYGRRVLPGVWLGSALLGLGHAWLSGTLSATTTVVTLVIAAGALLQAEVGRRLVTRWGATPWRGLESKRDLFALLFLGGMAASLTAASIGVTGLVASGLIGRAEVPLTWWNWYVGDALGVLLLAPLTLLMLGMSGRAAVIERRNDALKTSEERIAGDPLELERLNRELADHSRRTEAANLAKSAFLANMSHEIRTPLNGILGMTELALDAPLAPAVRESLETIKHSGQALLSIINDILDFSKIEAGKLDIEAVPLELPTLVQQALATLGPVASGKGLSLTIALDPRLPTGLIGDPGRLRQVLLNLLGNALKFTDEGQVGIRVQLVDRQVRGVVLQFDVQDTGVGIEPEKQRLIFEPFAQEDGSITRRYGGTGLGLSITSRLVQLMGGRLWLDSAPGQGSTFHFTVVLGHAADERAAAPRSAPDPQVGAAPTGDSPRVLRLLLVEDNIVNQKVGMGMLKRLGHQVAVANNGQEALDQLAAGPFDLVLMDMQMPVLDGLEATRQIRAREEALGLPRTTIIAITANAMASDQELCRAAGMDGFISKPLQAAALKAQLARV